MKTITKILLLGGVGAVIFALAKDDDATEGGDTFEPPGPPDLPDLPEGGEAGFDPTLPQPGTSPVRVDRLQVE